MRLIPGLFMLVLFTQTLSAQNSVCGAYHDYNGRVMLFRTDSTFRYLQQFDGWKIWCEGKWTYRRDTLYLTPVPVFDTMLVHGHRGYIDSLFLSSDNRSERFRGKHFPFMICQQDTEYIPDCFVSKNDALYWSPTAYDIDKKDKAWKRIDRSQTSGKEAAVAPSDISGRYEDESGSEIDIHPDSTFRFDWSGHMSSRWATGTWTVYKDTIYFHPYLFLDTVSLIDVRDLPYDSIFLSDDDSSQRFSDSAKNIFGSYWQSPEMVPYKLWMHKGKLYVVLPDGEIDDVKREDGFYGYKYHTWFTRSKEEPE